MSVAQVLELHTPEPSSIETSGYTITPTTPGHVMLSDFWSHRIEQTCRECHQEWPCRTAKALGEEAA